MKPITLVVALVTVAALLIFAQVRSNAQQEQSQRATEAYTPDVGELMAATTSPGYSLRIGPRGRWAYSPGLSRDRPAPQAPACCRARFRDPYAQLTRLN